MASPADILRLTRPHQHVKNIFVLLPLFFAGQLTETDKLVTALIAFVAFSLVASGIYVLNDLHDIAEDKIHPEKQNRPLASGRISSRTAWCLFPSLCLGGLVVALSLGRAPLATLAAYLVLNLAYSLKLKHVALLDVSIIASGFVLRLYMGSVSADIPLSQWIVVTTFLLALFLALAKRRDDLILQQRTGKQVRIASTGYSLPLIDHAITLLAAAVIVTYLQYTTSAQVLERLHSPYLYLTTLFVILGVLRYLQITFVFEQSASPTRVLLRDRFTQINLLLWAVSFVWILYL